MKGTDQILIENYILGKLSTREEQEFIHRCQQDPEFRSAYDEEQLLVQVINDQAAQDFLTKTREVMIRDGKDPRFRFGMRRLSLLFLTCLIVLVGTLITLKHQKPSDPKALFHEFFEPYPMILTERGNGDEPFLVLIEAYDQTDWVTVQAELNRIPTGTLPGPLKDLYLSIALLGQDNASGAEKLLERYRQDPADGLYQHTLEWYLALAFLQNGKVDEARELLIRLSRDVTSASAVERINKLLRQL